jgi:hypothetical protein
MRKARSLAVAIATVATIGGLTATSAMAGNVYTVNGSGTSGGTSKKPKPAKLNATFTVKSDDATGNLIPDVIKTYAISIEGGRMNKTALAKLPKCKISPADADQSNEQCSKKSIVGKGTLTAAVGTPGEPINPALTCTLPYNLYNIGGYKLGIFISATSQQCPVAVKQWIVTNISQKGNVVTTSFTTPEKLQQPGPGLFSPVMTASFALNPVKVKYKVKKKGKTRTKTVYTTESIGCKDKKRDVSVKFTSRAGETKTASLTVKC